MYSVITSNFPNANPSKVVCGFKSTYGKASNYVENGQWHHIVEQQTVCLNIMIDYSNSISNDIDKIKVNSKIEGLQRKEKFFSNMYKRIYKVDDLSLLNVDDLSLLNKELD